ncbi:2'-5' RNA ligase [Paenibacillus sp. UNC496MF]|uniref:RNA 2',3'-cyclic phosphodiesterase n=1 Tax=Paenibacillus sp. UNC496MF TaxID=1502753 RepID=UPI0008DEF7EB|nr:RNA 2',3'-cyclic phosphodiesterase [Paenibacillus sp. UNC496MF]SFI30956.1 2'-5' RNA ligase [Paenibacillus sp. UNC496MF]
MELFVGLDFPASVSQELKRVQRALRVFDPSGAYEPKENFHLTLHYIGEVASPDALTERLLKVNRKPFELTLHELGMFDIVGGNVVWVNVRAEPRLHDLHQRISGILAELSTGKKQYSFDPHISIAYDCRANISDVFSSCTVAAVTFEVSRFYLYEVSDLPEGMRFRKLNDFELKG